MNQIDIIKQKILAVKAAVIAASLTPSIVAQILDDIYNVAIEASRKANNAPSLSELEAVEQKVDHTRGIIESLEPKINKAEQNIKDILRNNADLLSFFGALEQVVNAINNRRFVTEISSFEADESGVFAAVMSQEADGDLPNGKAVYLPVVSDSKAGVVTPALLDVLKQIPCFYSPWSAVLFPPSSETLQSDYKTIPADTSVFDAVLFFKGHFVHSTSTEGVAAPTGFLPDWVGSEVFGTATEQGVPAHERRLYYCISQNCFYIYINGELKKIP